MPLRRNGKSNAAFLPRGDLASRGGWKACRVRKSCWAVLESGSARSQFGQTGFSTDRSDVRFWWATAPGFHSQCEVFRCRILSNAGCAIESPRSRRPFRRFRNSAGRAASRSEYPRAAGRLPEPPPRFCRRSTWHGTRSAGSAGACFRPGNWSGRLAINLPAGRTIATCSIARKRKGPCGG